MQFKEEIRLLGLMGSRGIQSILEGKKKGRVAGAGSRLIHLHPYTEGRDRKRVMNFLQQGH